MQVAEIGEILRKVRQRQAARVYQPTHGRATDPDPVELRPSVADLIAALWHSNSVLLASHKSVDGNRHPDPPARWGSVPATGRWVATTRDGREA